MAFTTKLIAKPGGRSSAWGKLHTHMLWLAVLCRGQRVVNIGKISGPSGSRVGMSFSNNLYVSFKYDYPLPFDGKTLDLGYPAIVEKVILQVDTDYTDLSDQVCEGKKYYLRIVFSQGRWIHIPDTAEVFVKGLNGMDPELEAESLLALLDGHDPQHLFKVQVY